MVEGLSASSRMQGDGRRRWSGRRHIANGLDRCSFRMVPVWELRGERVGEEGRAGLTWSYVFVARSHTPDGLLHGNMGAPGDACHIRKGHEVDSCRISEPLRKHGLPRRLAPFSTRPASTNNAAVRRCCATCPCDAQDMRTACPLVLFMVGSSADEDLWHPRSTGNS